MPRYRCGGWASFDGPCGATDCEDCYPGCRNCLICGELDVEEAPCSCTVCISCEEKFIPKLYEEQCEECENYETKLSKEKEVE